MNIKLVSDTGLEPLALADVKAQLRYTASDQDAYITGLIIAARMCAEFWNGRKQTVAQWDLAADGWPGCGNWAPGEMANPYFGFWPSDAYRLLASHPWGLNAIPLLAPLISVEAVTYKNSTGAVTTLVENTDYIVDTWKEPGIIAPMPGSNWPSAALWPSSAIHVQFTAGAVPNAAVYAAANPDLAPAQQVKNVIMQGMMLLVTDWFIARSPFDAIRFVAEPPFAVTALFTSDKLWK